MKEVTLPYSPAPSYFCHFIFTCLREVTSIVYSSSFKSVLSFFFLLFCFEIDSLPYIFCFISPLFFNGAVVTELAGFDYGMFLVKKAQLAELRIGSLLCRFLWLSQGQRGWVENSRLYPNTRRVSLSERAGAFWVVQPPMLLNYLSLVGGSLPFGFTFSANV